MNFKKIKKEIFYLRKAFLTYKKGWLYIYNKYFLAKKIFGLKGVDRPATIENLSVHILTNHRDIKMASWSVASFYLNAEIAADLFIHNDGSLTQKDKKILKSLFPLAKLIEPEDVLDKKLSKLASFLEVKNLRVENKNWWVFKKLIDPYLVSDREYRLIIDSDLIWLKRADEILDALGSDKSLITYTDHAGGFIKFKDGSVLDQEKAKYNSGIVFYKSKNFNLNKLTEYFEKLDLKDKKNNWFVEQAGYALALDNLDILDKEEYHVKAGIGDKTVVKHFTGPRRVLFYIEAMPLVKNKILK